MYNPIFTITNTILKSIGSIEASKEAIEKAPLLPYWEKKFQEDAILRTTHYGTHIEGNELSLNEVQKILDGERIVARERDVQEVINYRKVTEYMEHSKHIPVDQELLKRMHRIVVDKVLPQEKTGIYRKQEVVVRSSITGEISFRPPKSHAIIDRIQDLLEFINKDRDIHPVLKAGTVHYEFVRIHPFLDGNGRVGRALSTLVLFREGYDIRHFFSLEEHFDRDPNDYYEALQSVEKKAGDLSDWLVYFTTCVAQELSKIKERIERISIDTKLKKKLGGPVLLSERQLKIIEYIQEVGYFENKTFKSLFPMVSEDTILREMQNLVKKKIVKKKGKTKGVKYIINS